MSDSSSQLAGHVDVCTWEIIRGWARRPDRPEESVTLDLMIDDVVVSTKRADLYGEDLERAGIGNGCFRFSFELGALEELRVGDIHDVRVRDVDNHTSLPHIRLTRWAAASFEGAPLIDILANRYLMGEGLEIGALDRPQQLPSGARVRHVDVLSTPDLRTRYPEVSVECIVNVEIVDNGATLATVEDASADFLIANNVIEHVEDPIAALSNWHRVVRPGGIVFLAVPNPRVSEDRSRSQTSPEHVIRDHREGVDTSRHEHFREWVRDVERRPASEFEARTTQLRNADYPIHFHVWNELGCALLINAMIETTGRRFLIEHLALTPDRLETLLVLRVEEPRSSPAIPDRNDLER